MRALSAARLACRALRTFVDSNTTSLTITVRAADRQRWEAGQLPPPLAVRWPRCRHVTVKVARTQPAVLAEDAALLALLPFAEPGAGRHVETLRVCPLGSTGTYGEALVCRLVPLLPNLRDLDFGPYDGCMSFDPLQQHLMFSALASLPSLERLTLPGCRSLDRVGALAASLRCLTIVRGGEDHLSPAAIAGLLQLQRLQELELPYCCQLGVDGSGSEVAGSSGIQALLRSSLPPSLQQLVVGLVFANNCAVLSLQLHAGSLSHATLRESEICLKYSCELATVAQLLLRSPAMGPTLELLSIEGFLTLDDMQQADQVQLRELLQRCSKVQTYGVTISSDAPAVAVIMELLPLLGPDEVTLDFGSFNEIEFSFPSTSGKMSGISGPAADMSTGAVVNSSADVAAPPATAEGRDSQQQCSLPPGPADLLRAALQHMAVGGGPSSSMLLLQGPIVATMAKLGLAPAEWVRCLAAKADAAAPGNDWGGKPVLSCQAVPLVNGVLLACSSATAAAAVAAAAEAAALAAAVPVPLLEVLRVQSVDVNNDAKAVLVEALQLAMTAFWEGSAHGGEHCTQRERLQCMLELHGAFNALPEDVDL